MTAEELASVTLEHLRAIRAKQDEQGERLGRIESRLSSLETTVAGMRCDCWRKAAKRAETKSAWT